ncbi:Na+/H+ antiporter NhaC family protein [Bacillus xiapuensis]|uniref:Na+/H+ antiporter NhaC family protein n=1 Tax=Bacillus xiapuensis TaxID=2014075 RepID=UPI000C245B43|nr:Na+/H+ antiporter NhaC family protein [Bacillus xiapuensis]
MGIGSMLPLAVALVMAILTRNVVVSLFFGVMTGVWFLAEGSLFKAIHLMIGDYFFGQLGDHYNAGVIVLLMGIGGFVSLLEKSGGAAAFARQMSRFLGNKRKVQFAAWLSGIGVFFTDSGSPLIVGPLFEKLADKVKMSREKLAWILDSTASPMAILIPFISWGVYIIGLIGKEFSALGLKESELTAFMKAIPFQFYAISVLLMVPLLALIRCDFGPMKRAEVRAERLAQPQTAKATTSIQSAGSAKPFFVWVPIVVLLAVMTALLVPLGFPFKEVEGLSFLVALTAGYLFASLVLAAFMLLYKIKKASEILNMYIAGMKNIVSIGVTLVLAWSLGAVIKELEAASYLVGLMEGNVPGYLIPVMIFLVGAVISFSTGSSWGTFAILLPLAIPAAVELEVSVPAAIAAVLSGGLFGDHCSPISDTTILSSTGAGCDLIDHVKTQTPYALVNAAASVTAFLIAGITGSALALGAAIAVMIILVLVFDKLSHHSFPFQMPPKQHEEATLKK